MPSSLQVPSRLPCGLTLVVERKSTYEAMHAVLTDLCCLQMRQALLVQQASRPSLDGTMSTD